MKIIRNHIFLLSAIIVLTAFNSFAQTERREGIKLYEDGSYAEAIKNLQKAVETDENDGEAWRFLGMALAANQEGKNAVKAFEKAGEFADAELNATYDAPVKLTKIPRNQYTEEARRNNVQGRIKLAVEFGKDGKIKRVFPIKTLPYGLTEKGIKAAGEIEFEPAVRDGKAVTVIKFVEYSFSIY